MADPIYCLWRYTWRAPSYVRSPEHQKKIKSERDVARAEWRDRRGERKKPRHPYRGWAKRVSNGDRRAWERGRIAKEDWDAFSGKEDYSFRNKRMWD